MKEKNFGEKINEFLYDLTHSEESEDASTEEKEVKKKETNISKLLDLFSDLSRD